MDYYTEKRKAHLQIKQLSVRQHENTSDIIFHINEKYGFGKKIVLDYLAMLIERGLLKPKKYECGKCGSLINILSGEPTNNCSCGAFKYKKISK